MEAFEADYYKERVDELTVANEHLRSELEQARQHIHRLETAVDNRTAELQRLTMIANHLYND